MDATEQLALGVGLHARYMLLLEDDRKAVLARVEALCAELPHTKILLSVPGVGIRTAARILMCVGDLSAFETPAQLASYAGICPQQRLSGVSINSSGPNRGGNKALKNALWYCAFASIKNHERSRQYYDRKRAEGKRHNAAVMCLARRKCNVIFALMKNMAFYSESYNQPPVNKPTAA